jgi:hypothetical protein
VGVIPNKIKTEEVKGMKSLESDTDSPPEDSDQEIENENKEKKEWRPAPG